MKTNAADYFGKRYGKLIILSLAGFYVSKKQKRAIVKCRCDCGKEKDILLKDIKNGKIKSCSCLQKENQFYSHRMTHTTEYRIWHNMITRCTNPNSDSYKYYGKRGISVCGRWKTFENFFADMGSRPSLKLTLDRINNDGNYEPENCRWATSKEQRANQRIPVSQRLFTFNGETNNLTRWAKKLNINYQTLHTRMNVQKLSFLEAITFSRDQGTKQQFKERTRV